MKLNRLRMIEAADRLIEKRDREIAEIQEHNAAYQKAYFENWQKKYYPIWTAQIARLQELIENGEPIREADIPDRYGRRSDGDCGAFWQAPHGPTQVPGRLTNLIALSRFLKGVEDSTISETALKNIGFGNLKYVVMEMALDGQQSIGSVEKQFRSR